LVTWLPSSAAAPIAAATPAATAVAAAWSARTAAAAGPHEGREPSALWASGFICGDDVGHQLLTRLQLAFDQLGRLPVGYAEPQVHRLKLLVGPDEDASGTFYDRQRSEQRVDGRGLLRSPGRTWRGRFLAALATLTAAGAVAEISTAAAAGISIAATPATPAAPDHSLTSVSRTLTVLTVIAIRPAALRRPPFKVWQL
jgi:hypothetical protein